MANFLRTKIESAYDCIKIGLTIVSPENECAGIVYISHGMAEHRDRYLDFMKYLAENGYIAVIHDHRGHGESVLSESDYGYMYKGGDEALVKDLHQGINFAKSLYPGYPLILFGHSMGSIIARKYMKEYDDIDKVILCGPPPQNKMASLGLLMANLMSIFHSDRYRSNFLNSLSVGAYNKGYDLNNAWLSTDVNTVNKYNEDSRCGFIFTLNGFKNLYRMLIDIFKKSGWTNVNVSLPILFITGEDDPVIQSKEDFIKSIDFLKDIGYQNINYKLYKNMRHELLNERDKDIIYADILNWIKCENKSKVQFKQD